MFTNMSHERAYDLQLRLEEDWEQELADQHGDVDAALTACVERYDEDYPEQRDRADYIRELAEKERGQ